MILPDQDEKEGLESREFEGKKILTGILNKREIEFVSGEIVVKFKSGKERDNAFLKRLFVKDLKGAKIKRDFDRMGVGLIEFDQKVDVLRVCDELEKNPDVEFAEPNVIDRIAAVQPNDPNFVNQWGLSKINAPDAWGWETGVSSVMIAILDSGIPMQGTSLCHPDLMDTSRIILGKNCIDNNSIPKDDRGHGTHVAGIASAQSNNSFGVAGLSWGTRLYIVKVFDNYGLGSSYYFYNGVIDAVDYAMANNYRLIINYSGGGPSSKLKEDAIIYAGTRNCLIVAAAGNGKGPVGWPAAYSSSYDNVIAVSATDSADKFAAAYSNFGPEINVSAPGTHIYSTMPNYHVSLNDKGYKQDFDYMTGTSMAAPHVSALAALIASCDKGLKAADIRDIIEQTSDDLGDPKWDKYYGYGRIDAYQAVYEATPKLIFCKALREAFACAYSIEPGFCFYKTEPAVCNFLKETQGCNYRFETLCNYVTESGHWCINKIEAVQIHCGNAEIIGCGREYTIIPDPGIDPREIYVRKDIRRDATGVETRQLKYLRPLTKRAPLSHKKRYYPNE